jgi:hypothetical protein
MSRRIEVELTSERPDGSWTWRAAGAREPKGELDGSLLPQGSKVGDVLKADADFDIDGVTIIAVKQPGGKREISGRLELLPSEREFQPVTSTLVGRRDRGDRGDRGDRRDRPPRDRDRDRGDRGDRPDRGPRPERRDRPPREGGDRPPRSERPPAPPPVPERPKPKKLRPGRAHREELLASLSPDKRLIAEQLLKGGIPAVRTALDEQNAKARAEGQSEVPTAGVLHVAEDLAPAARIADWLDRAEAALADIDEVSLRDLRAVVTSATDVAREERTKELAATLKEALDRRTGAELEQWVGDIKLSLGAGRVVRALRLASRPPLEGQALPAELSTELATAASAALTADVMPDRWATLLDAVAYSPVRGDVVAAGVPAEPGDELLAAVRKHAGRTPQLATLFGVEPPTSAPKQRRQRPPKPKPVKAVEDQLAHAVGAPILVAGRRIPPPPKPTGAPQPSPAEGDEVPAAESRPDEAPAAESLPDEAPAAAPEPSPALGEVGAPSATESLPDDAPATPPAASSEPVEVPAAPPAAPDEVGEEAATGASATANDEPVPQSAPDPEAPGSDTVPGADEGADSV